ncbi:MAG TPA: hypothetical protein PLR06_04230 [Cyclobacteriaceae bacterium]|nr:hypothetical protein [Cyclobacteriaceae bacterium]
MRKVIFVLIVSGVMVSTAWSQKPKPVTTQPQTTQVKPAEQKTTESVTDIVTTHFAKKYGVASRWNDLEVAKDALYDLIIEYPGNDSLIFALAYYYYEHQNNTSAVLVCQDLLARNPKNVGALELSAIGYESLNIKDRSLQNYESLFLITNDNTALYKMAFLQYDLKRYPECITNADFLLAKPEATTLKVTFNDKDKKPKEYTMKVALLNLKGMVYKDQADKVNAKKFFEEALAAAPDFVPAKDNLASLASMK